jgi:hypothetical protein
VSALILDAGALVAVDNDDRAMIARLRASQQQGLELRTNAMVVAQVWRDRHGRHAGDRIVTSDPSDISRLAAAAGNRAVIVTC